LSSPRRLPSPGSPLFVTRHFLFFCTTTAMFLALVGSPGSIPKPGNSDSYPVTSPSVDVSFLLQSVKRNPGPQSLVAARLRAFSPACVFALTSFFFCCRTRLTRFFPATSLAKALLFSFFSSLGHTSGCFFFFFGPPFPTSLVLPSRFPFFC